MPQPDIISRPAAEHRVTVPTGEDMVSNQETEFDIPNVPTTANKARIFNKLKSGNLLSVGQYCDQDCSAHFYKNKMVILNKQQQIILQGPRDWSNRLWKATIPIKRNQQQHRSLTPTPVINAMIEAKTPKTDLMEFLYKSMGAPPKQTFINAINNKFLKTVPFLSKINVKKYLQKCIETYKGHMQQQRKNLVLPFQQTEHKEDDTPVSPLMLDGAPQKTHVILAAITDINDKKLGWTYGDLTGKYPIQSTHGNNYILVRSTTTMQMLSWRNH